MEKIDFPNIKVRCIEQKSYIDKILIFFFKD